MTTAHDAALTAMNRAMASAFDGSTYAGLAEAALDALNSPAVRAAVEKDRDEIVNGKYVSAPKANAIRSALLDALSDGSPPAGSVPIAHKGPLQQAYDTLLEAGQQRGDGRLELIQVAEAWIALGKVSQ